MPKAEASSSEPVLPQSAEVNQRDTSHAINALSLLGTKAKKRSVPDTPNNDIQIRKVTKIATGNISSVGKSQTTRTKSSIWERSQNEKYANGIAVGTANSLEVG